MRAAPSRTRLGGRVAQQVGQLGAVGAVLVHAQLQVLPKRLRAAPKVLPIRLHCMYTLQTGASQAWLQQFLPPLQVLVCPPNQPSITHIFLPEKQQDGDDGTKKQSANCPAEQAGRSFLPDALNWRLLLVRPQI